MTDVTFKVVERAYTVAEIDQMRKCVEKLVEGPIYAEYNGSGFWSGGSAYDPRERTAKAEDRLRTYMINGTAPVELEEAAQAVRQVEREQRDASIAMWEARQNAIATAPA